MKRRIEDMNEKYIEVNRKEFYSACASLVTGSILARIHEKYNKKETKEKKEAA